MLSLSKHEAEAGCSRATAAMNPGDRACSLTHRESAS